MKFIHMPYRKISAVVKSGDAMQTLGDIGAAGQASALPEDARKLLRAEIDKWKVSIDRAGIERQ